jgi:hypothetical protein
MERESASQAVLPHEMAKAPPQVGSRSIVTLLPPPG